MEDFTATRPNLVIVLDLPSEDEVLTRVRGRRVDVATCKDKRSKSGKSPIRWQKYPNSTDMACERAQHDHIFPLVETGDRGGLVSCSMPSSKPWLTSAPLKDLISLEACIPMLFTTQRGPLKGGLSFPRCI